MGLCDHTAHYSFFCLSLFEYEICVRAPKESLNIDKFVFDHGYIRINFQINVFHKWGGGKNFIK